MMYMADKEDEGPGGYLGGPEGEEEESSDDEPYTPEVGRVLGSPESLRTEAESSARAGLNLNSYVTVLRHCRFCRTAFMRPCNGTGQLCVC